MFFRRKYSFNVPQNKEALTQALKDLKKEDLIQKTLIGKESYSFEFNWDEFVVTRKVKMFERGGGPEPDAYIRLTSLSENLTRIDATIKFSEITWISLIIIQGMIIAGSFFGGELIWWGRILLFTGSSGLFYFIIWLIFVQESNTLKKVIQTVFREYQAI